MQTRYPGFEIVPDASGFYKVTTIYKGGPADHDFAKIASGNFIISVNGVPLRRRQLLEALRNGSGNLISSEFKAKPQDGAWTIRITPVNAKTNTTLQYEKWVADHQAMVEKMSNGEIGYLHIRAMNAPSLAQFEEGIFADNHFRKRLSSISASTVAADKSGAARDSRTAPVSIHSRTRFHTSARPERACFGQSL